MVDPSGDQQEVERRTQLAMLGQNRGPLAPEDRLSVGRGRTSRNDRKRCWRKGTAPRKAQDVQEAGRLVEQLRQAVLVYQLRQELSRWGRVNAFWVGIATTGDKQPSHTHGCKYPPINFAINTDGRSLRMVFFGLSLSRCAWAPRPSSGQLLYLSAPYPFFSSPP